MKTEDLLIVSGITGLVLLAIISYAKPEIKGEISSVEIKPC